MSQNNNRITIGNITIHQSANGLYLLTDLWKASGEQLKDLPAKFMALKSTIELCKELDSESHTVPISDSVKINIEIVLGKKAKGTYVCEELVYAYAMWVNPKFYLLVVRTFRDLVNANTVNELIAVKNQLDNYQQDLFHREPRDKQSLAVILQIATAKVKPYFDYLVSIGEVGRRWIPQHDRAEYFATEQSRHIIGRKGNTVLFDDSVREAFPESTTWLDV